MSEAVQEHASVNDELEEQIRRAAHDLQSKGYAIVEGVLSRADCEEYVDAVWAWLSGLGTGIERNDPTTWQPPRWPPHARGIVNTLGVAHQDFVWRVRSHPRLLRARPHAPGWVFERLWGTSALLSSFDSINILAPGGGMGQAHQHPGASPDPLPAVSEGSATTTPASLAWLHTDQAPLRRGICCVQGLVNLVDVGPETTGTLLVKEGSHAGHAEFFERFTELSAAQQAATGDHYMFAPGEAGYWARYPSRALCGPAGSVFLWDSRTAHTNVMPAEGRAWRHVVYACYQPAALAGPEDLALKREAWHDHQVTTHWPARNVRLFPALGAGYYGSAAAGAPKNYSDFRVKHTRDRIEDAALRRLAGVEPYPPADVKIASPLLDLSSFDEAAWWRGPAVA